jgi:hypothetical protein
MIEEQNIVYTQGILLQARIELEAMLATNQERIHRGETLAYDEDAIRNLIDKYGIHHNALIINLTGR